MKKRLILLVLTCVIGGIGVQAQRPVEDTTYIGGDADYLYDSIHLTNSYCIDTRSGNYSYPLDHFYGFFLGYLRQQLVNQGGNLQNPSDFDFERYPFLASLQACRYIMGQEFPVSEDMVVLGLAVCPERARWTTWSRMAFLPRDSVVNYYNGFKSVDSTIAGSETEYVQLYTMQGGTPHFQREGGWRWDDPHRTMFFNHLIIRDSTNLLVQIFDTVYTPLYEVMFDSGIYISNESIVLAVTHNNNGMVWADTCFDTVYPRPHICTEHYYPTAYTFSVSLTDVPPLIDPEPDPTWWYKFDTYPWWSTWSVSSEVIIRATIGGRTALNVFLILDTLFGTPCATVSNLQAAAVDSLWATVMWSADARHHEWDVEYWPTGQPSGSATMVVDSVPTVTLTGLTPGTEYGVRVCGLCDKDNYSPWSDTLLFTTTRDTTPDTVMPPPDTLGIPAMGNLDRYTRMMPNPAGDWVSVLSSYRLESVAVYDLAGRRMLEQPAEGISAMVDVSALPRGTYIVAIRTLQGVATKKLVVER